ncbi:hypothetical protein GIB67_011158 [Kingdonia uniflora]|uniref:protein disulfide-isomerase n=1 Tax=Kingdonia uniflora TaxID=39325 RepID=A0A7J7PAC4_9MAGN|nr:hypothetical protein GIB67_011158 [Kingdonia uniflora]
MSRSKPSSRLISFSVTLLILLGLFISVMASETVVSNGGRDDDDDEGFQELLALDEEEERQEGSSVKSSDAQVLKKAQKIVLELSNDNSKRIIDGNEYVLVLGFAPWCARSAEMMPQFAEAASVLKEMASPVVLAKLDAERHPKAASVLGIKGFPTLLLFVNGSSQVYTGGFAAEEIVIWAKKKTGVSVTIINSVPEAQEFIKKHKMFVIGFFENFEGSDYKEFIDAAIANNEIEFAEAGDYGVAKVLFPDAPTKTHFLGLVKSEPEEYVIYEDTFEKENILEFLEYNKFPLVSVLTELNSVRVYSSPIKLQVFVFAKANEFQNLLLPLQTVARKFKSKVMFVYIHIAEENLAKPFLTLFGLEELEKTVVAAFDNKISVKYLLESDPTQSNIDEFCSRLLHGTLSPYFKSQPIPHNSKTAVQIVVGRTFDELVLSSPQNVFLEIYAPWCINCDTTSKQVEKLAKHFEGLDNLVFARIDASSNEHPKLQIDDFPTLLFYSSIDKSNPIKVSTKSGLKELAAFIKKKVRVAKDSDVSAQDQSTKDEL